MVSESDSLFENKRILITGACGSVGRELIGQLLNHDQNKPAEIIGIDNNESALFFLEQEYLEEPRARFFVVDIRDIDELRNKMRGIDIVFHAAALKHVVLCERSPAQAVMTNINGVQNVISAAIDNDVEKVIFTSSDKAVNPTNVMGTSKLMGERLMTAANSSKRGRGPVFASTRFGNVLGSNGSVIPIFYNQIMAGGPVTLTDMKMTRFVMGIDEAAKLVLDSAILSKGGEVFITKMPIVRIVDLAKAMINMLSLKYEFKADDIDIKIIGTKPGEKLYEELMSDEETRRAIELERYFSILPAFRDMYNKIRYDYQQIVDNHVTNPYNSSNEVPLSIGQIEKILIEKNIFDKPRDEISHRYWPGDKREG